MKQKKTFLALLALFSLSMSSVIAQTANVYVGGAANGKATVWKNGTPAYLSTRESCISSLVVDNGDVYAAGIEYESGGYFAKLWVNGVIQHSFNNGVADDVFAFSVAVSGSNVYVAGMELLGFSVKGKLWKNGIAETGYSEAAALYSIFISGNDVYVAGVTTTATAAVWKNGTLLYNLASNDGYGCATSVVVVDDDVYTAGYEQKSGKYVSKVWKNNKTLYTLGTGSFEKEIIGLYIFNGDIYVSGFEENEKGTAIAKLWKNGIGTNLTNGTTDSYASSVFVSGSDVYVTGTEDSNKALLWKNDVLTTLASGINCVAICVFVTEGETGMSEIIAKKISVYPNPTSGELRIDSEELRIEKVEIFDMSGRNLLLSTFPIFQHTTIDISQLSAGTYFVKITTESGEAIKKVIKE